VPDSRVKDVAELPDPVPLFPADLLALTLWAARYYVTAPGSMIGAALPPGLARKSAVTVSRAAPGDDADDLAEGERKALALIPARGGVPLRKLKVTPAMLARLEAAGRIRIETAVPAARVKEKQARVLHAAWKDLDGALASCARAPRQREILKLLSSAADLGVPLDEIFDRLGAVGPAVKALRDKGLVRIKRVEVRRSPVVLDPVARPGPRTPTPEQAAALGAIFEALEPDASRAFLLMGVTGSGKTEVYLRSIERCLASGRDALYLVPEIALTPLLARELKARLGRDLALLHSSLGPGERYDEWRRARLGEARIVLGPRSAVLAPMRKLGLIVVDEEQDGSYKQEEDPRYNARDLALVRGRDAGAVVILGSATPSVESYHAAVSGRHALLRLPSRILDRPMARVKVVDMREEFARSGREEVVSPSLREAVAERLARGEQAIILLNRRGYAPYVLCRRCGSHESCHRCSLALTYHRSDNLLKCHYCGYHRGLPKACSTCRSEKIALAGAGTEKLEEQVRAIFPEARLARLDRDAARGRRAPGEILSAFERGEFNLLVGTQMVAKGHDFPGVTIVGVIGADTLLALPDYRAAERTFQLLTQVAGRSGRGEEPGEVIVQAFDQDHYAIQAAVAQDYLAFYEKESRFRRIMKFPPFVVLANVLVMAGDTETGVRRARLVGDVLTRIAGDTVAMVGPSVAPIARLKGRYRYQVLLRSSSRRKLSDLLNAAAGELAGKGLASPRDLIMDMDPVSLG
jgi:primosomal protein N' (replication factor Y)